MELINQFTSHKIATVYIMYTTVRLNILTLLLLLPLKIQFFQEVTLCCWVSSKQHFEGSQCFIFRVKLSKKSGCLTLKMKALQSFETLRNTHPTTQCHIWENLALQVHTALYNVIVKKYDKVWIKLTMWSNTHKIKFKSELVCRYPTQNINELL